jgi:dTDP-4-dehydrorhamnose 3,5-epimerase
MANIDESRILIVGSNGQLGRALQARYPKALAVDRDELDISDWKSVEAYDWSKIDIILNAAAYTKVDAAETDEGREAAWQVNAVAPAYLARIAHDKDIILVHVSSDYVFDGTKVPHSETESYTPLGVYGCSKAAGDIAVSTAPKHYILRTSWVIGDGPNFVRTMMGLAAKDISPSVVSDQVGRLTFSTTLTDAIVHLISSQPEYGIYNVTDDGEPASWADVTRAIFKELGRDDLTVTDTTTEAYFADKTAVGAKISPRPLGSALDLSKIKTTGFELPQWREELAKYIKAEQAAAKES